MLCLGADTFFPGFCLQKVSRTTLLTSCTPKATLDAPERLSIVSSNG